MPPTRRFLFALTLALPLLAAAQPAADGVTTEGATFAGTLALAGSDLQLNGTGVRAVAIYKGYVAAMYLPQRTDDPTEAARMAGPKRIEMRMLLDIPAAEFTKAFRKGVQRNAPAATVAAMSERIDRFAALIDGVGRVRKGDIVDLDFDPRRGSTLLVNGKARGEPVPGADLYAALLLSFVGDKPYDKKLKAGLLGRTS